MFANLEALTTGAARRQRHQWIRCLLFAVTNQSHLGERMFNFIQSGKHIFCVNEDLSVVLCLHKMVVDLKFSRFEDQPWGFRLTGGKDFPLPLTVVKVSNTDTLRFTVFCVRLFAIDVSLQIVWISL